MKTKQPPKIHAVYEFFLKEGFEHTVEEVAEAVHVTPKTLFNRYKTKSRMETVARKYWHRLLYRRLMEKTSFCNNALEKMILLICETSYCMKQESYYFEKEVEVFLKDEENAFIISMNQFLKEGMEADLFNKAINVKEYIHFFMHNLFTYFPQHFNADNFYHILSPVFLPETHLIYNQLDINQIIN